jgi:hypothetical protein
VCELMPPGIVFVLSCGSPGNNTVKLPSVLLYLFHSSVCPAKGVASSNTIQKADIHRRMISLFSKAIFQGFADSPMRTWDLQAATPVTPYPADMKPPD